MSTFDVAMTGAGPFTLRLVYTVTPVSGGVQVAATLQWLRSAYGYGSYVGAAPYSLDIGGSVKSGTRAFNAPAGGAIAPQWLETHSKVFTSGTSTYITASFSPGTQSAGTGAINGLTVRIATASTSSFSPSNALTAGTAVTVETNRTDGSFTHDITYEFGSAKGTIGTGVGASTSWTPPPSMLTAIPNATQAAGTITTVTKSGGTVVGSTKTGYTLAAPASVVPTISSVTYQDQNPDVVSVVGKPVAGLSSVKLTVNAAGAYGSTVTATTASMLGKTVSSGGVIPVTQGGSIGVTGKVTDSRGRTGSWSGTLDALSYANPKPVSMQVRRCNSAGTPQDDGQYLRVDLNATVSSLVNGSEKNAITVRIFTRPNGGSVWTARNVIAPGGLAYNTFVVVTGGGVFLNTASWDVRVQVEDKFTAVPVDTTVSTMGVTLDLSGTNVGVGKVWERGALDVAGDIYQDGSRVVARDTLNGDLPGRLAPIAGSVRDLNLVAETGWSRGANMINAPDPTGWYWVMTIVHDTSWVYQEAYGYPSGGSQPITWQRRKRAGTWDAWTPQYNTAAEVDGRIAAWPGTPYRMSAGRGTSSASGAVTVTFPAGRFTQPPRVQVTPGMHANVLTPRLAADPTATSFQVQMFTMPGAALVAANFDWTAVQMTAGSGSG
ncbi:DUF859 family phage minor structural protein [Microbacterium sp.]|uniref:DUF859 family phage minor structural protein n=1 Tax=Microbacterium sp. TaxID=51671 RepID=UPI003A8D6892